MEKIKIFDAEMQLMNKIWDEGSIKAIDLANWATANLGWKKNSTYSMLKKLLEKNVVKRSEPGFVLTPLVTRAEVAQEETTELVEKMYKGNMKMFLTSLISHKDLDEGDVETLKKLINDTKEE